MDRKTLLLSALLATLAVGVLHLVALLFYFYWVYWWYDVMMHFLAGVAGALATSWVLYHSKLFFKSELRLLPALLLVVGAVLVVGVAWEFFEYYYGMTDSHEGWRQDIVNDLVLDTMGALIGSWFALRKTNPAEI